MSKARKNGIRFNLTFKISFLPILLIFAAGVLVFYLINQVQHYKSSEAVTSSSGYLRIMSQQYLKEVLLSTRNISVNPAFTAEKYNQIINALTYGGVVEFSDGRKAAVPAAIDVKIKDKLDEQKKEFENIQYVSSKLLKHNRLNDQQSQLLAELYRISVQLEDKASQVVESYDRYLGSVVTEWEKHSLSVEFAERQKMYIQQQLKDVLFVAQGVAADYQSSRTRLYENINLLLEGGNVSLLGGEVIELSPPPTEEIRFTLQEQKGKLEQFTAVSNEYLMMTNRNVDQSIQLSELFDRGELLSALTASTHESLINYYQTEISNSLKEVILAAILVAVFGFILIVYFSNFAITRPLRIIRDSLFRLNSGDVKVYLKDIPSDEIGDIALAVNTNAKNTQSKISAISEIAKGKWEEGVPLAGHNDRLGYALRNMISRFKSVLSSHGQDTGASSLFEGFDEDKSPKRLPSPDRLNLSNRISTIIGADISDEQGLIDEHKLLDHLIQKKRSLSPADSTNDLAPASKSTLETPAETIVGQPSQNLVTQIASLKNQVAQAEAQNELLKKENREFSSRFQDSDKVASEIKHSMQQANQSLADKMNQIMSLETTVRKLEQEKNDWERKAQKSSILDADRNKILIQERESQINALKQDLLRSDQMLQDLKGKMTDRFDTVAQMEAKIRELESQQDEQVHKVDQKYQTELDGLNHKISSLTDKVSDKNLQIQELREELSNSSSQLDALQRQQNEINILRESSQQEIRDLKSKIDEQRHSIEARSNEYNDLNSLNVQLQSELANLKDERSRLSEEYEDIKRMHSQSHAKISDLESKLRAACEDAEEAKRQVSEYKVNLSQADKRLSATRQALRASIDELQDRGLLD